MKFFVFCLLVLASLAQVPTLWTFPQLFTGKADNWHDYTGSPGNGIYIDVDFSSLGLVNVPSVITSLGCDAHCWTTTGGSEVYNLTNT